MCTRKYIYTHSVKEISQPSALIFFAIESLKALKRCPIVYITFTMSTSYKAICRRQDSNQYLFPLLKYEHELLVIQLAAKICLLYACTLINPINAYECTLIVLHIFNEMQTFIMRLIVRIFQPHKCERFIVIH